MQTATAQIHYVSDDFAPGSTIPYQLMIDAGTGLDPWLALFDSQKKLKFFGSQESYEALFPDQPLGSLQLERVRAAVATVDLMFFPSEVYEPEKRNTYASYLLDDGVTAIQEIVDTRLKSNVLYRPDLHNMTALFHQFPELGTVPLSYLLPAGLISTGSESVLYIHKGDRDVVFWAVDQESLYYHNVFQCVNEDEFNYYLLQVLRLLGERRSDCRVLISGNVDIGDSYYQRITKYQATIEIADPAALSGLSVPELPAEIRVRLLPVCLLAVD